LIRTRSVRAFCKHLVLQCVATVDLGLRAMVVVNADHGLVFILRKTATHVLRGGISNLLKDRRIRIRSRESQESIGCRIRGWCKSSRATKVRQHLCRGSGSSDGAANRVRREEVARIHVGRV